MMATQPRRAVDRDDGEHTTRTLQRRRTVARDARRLLRLVEHNVDPDATAGRGRWGLAY